MAESEAQRRVQAALSARAQAEQQYQDDWEAADKPTTVNGAGVVRQLGAQPLDARQLLSNTTAGAGVPIAGAAVPGGIVGDWVPRFREEVSVVRREKLKLYYAQIIREDFVNNPPLPPGGVSSFPDAAGYKYWLYRGDGSSAVEIPGYQDWEYFGEFYHPAGTNEVSLADIGVEVGAYASPETGSGIAPFVTVWGWRKTWDPGNPEPTYYNASRFQTAARYSKEDESNIIIRNRFGVQEQNQRTIIYVRDQQNPYMSMGKNGLYLYNGIGSLLSNSRHGIYYYRLPQRASTLSSTPTRFAEYPGFVGAGTDDWLSEWPDVATGLVDPTRACYRDRFGDFNINFSGNYFLDTFSVFSPSVSGQIRLGRSRVQVNTLDTCTVSEADEILFDYLPPSNLEDIVVGDDYLSLRSHSSIFAYT